MSDKASDFAQVALKNGLIDRAQLDQCLAMVEEAREEGRNVALEDVLLDEGYLTEHQIQAVHQRLVREIGGYKVLAKLGSGGMGSVYKAEQVSLGKIVALKILPPKYARDQAFLARFDREARSLAKVNHRNIVRAIDFGKDKGFYYLSMEFVEGQSLYDLVKRDGPFPEERALDVAAQIADGLSHAAGQGLVHRDVKPENILLTGEGDVKILDFGLAKPDEENASFKTTAGITFGTPHFMSPEQVRAEELDTRSDLYSIGATLFYLLTGKTPFSGKNDVEVMTAHLDKPVPDPRKVRPEVSKNVARVVRRLMAKSPADRYQDGAELFEDLERLRAGRPLRFAGEATSSGRAEVGRGRLPRLLLASGAGACVVLACALALRLAFRERPAPGPEVAAEPEDDRPEPPPVQPPRDPVAELRAAIDGLRRRPEGSATELAASLAEAEALVERAFPTPLAGEAGQLRDLLATSYARRALEELSTVQAEAGRLASLDRFSEAADAVRSFARTWEGSEAARRTTQLLFDLAGEEDRRFAELLGEADRIAASGDLEAAARALSPAAGFARPVHRDEAASRAAGYRARAAAPGEEPPRQEPERPAGAPRGDAAGWLARSIELGRARRYDELAETGASIDGPEVHLRLAEVASARRFLGLAAARLARRPAGSSLELDGGRSVEFVRLEGDVVRCLEGGVDSTARVADLSANALAELVLDPASPESALAAGHFFALEGYPSAARRWLAEGGLPAAAIDRVLAAWKTEEAGRVLVGTKDAEARELLAGARTYLEEGRAAEAEKAIRRLLDRFAGSSVVEEASEEIASLLRSARIAQVDLAECFSGSSSRRDKEGVHSVVYRFSDPADPGDWSFSTGPPSVKSGVLSIPDGVLTLWKGVWTDFSFDCEWSLVQAGTIRFRFRQKSGKEYYELLVSARPDDARFELRRRTPAAPNAEPIGSLALDEFFPEKGTLLWTRTRRLEIVAQGSRLRVLVGGKTAFDVEDESIAMGGFGIEAAGDKAIKSIAITGRLDPAWELETREALLDRADLARAAGLDGLGDGLVGTGFEGKDFGKPLARRIDSLFAFRFPGQTPAAEGLPGENWSIRWRGWVLAPADGTYRFVTRNDDGVRLRIGEALAIDDWRSHGAEDREGRIDLKRGIYPVELEFFDDTSDAVLLFFWQYGSDPRRLIDGRHLFHSRKDAR